MFGKIVIINLSYPKVIKDTVRQKGRYVMCVHLKLLSLHGVEYKRTKATTI